MDVLGWLWWLFAGFVGLVWSVAWFLLGGWVSTLAQVSVIVLIVFGYKYGWRRAPAELMARIGSFGRFVWNWMRSGDGSRSSSASGGSASAGPAGRPRRNVSRRQPGDVRINISTCMTLLMLGGLWLVAATL
ncbi:MAG: hypothetical protein AB7L90_12850 [Hyphomicrobiaceae bacterium]